MGRDGIYRFPPVDHFLFPAGMDGWMDLGEYLVRFFWEKFQSL